MIPHSESLCLQMSTIWADTVDEARATARDFVFAGLPKKEICMVYTIVCTTMNLSLYVPLFLMNPKLENVVMKSVEVVRQNLEAFEGRGGNC